MTTLLTGRQFNKNFKDIMYKFLNNNHKFTYKLGLNMDTLIFNPSDDPGGLHFCQEYDSVHHFNDYGSKVGIVKIPNDAQVYIKTNNFKADKLIINQIKTFDEMPSEFWLGIVKRDGSALKNIKTQFQTPNVINAALQQDGRAIYYLKQQSPEACLIAVQQTRRVRVLLSG